MWTLEMEKMHLEKNTWIKLFIQNDFTVVLKIFTADIEYQFFQRSWHTVLTSDVSLSPWSIPGMHQIIHKHTRDWFTESNIIFFHTFELLNVSNASSHICGYVNSRKRLLRCVKKEKGSQIHLLFFLRCDTTELLVHSEEIFVHSNRVTG